MFKSVRITAVAVLAVGLTACSGHSTTATPAPPTTEASLSVPVVNGTPITATPAYQLHFWYKFFFSAYYNRASTELNTVLGELQSNAVSQADCQTLSDTMQSIQRFLAKQPAPDEQYNTLITGWQGRLLQAAQVCTSGTPEYMSSYLNDATDELNQAQARYTAVTGE